MGPSGTPTLFRRVVRFFLDPGAGALHDVDMNNGAATATTRTINEAETLLHALDVTSQLTIVYDGRVVALVSDTQETYPIGTTTSQLHDARDRYLAAECHHNGDGAGWYEDECSDGALQSPTREEERALADAAYRTRCEYAPTVGQRHEVWRDVDDLHQEVANLERLQYGSTLYRTETDLAGSELYRWLSGGNVMTRDEAEAALREFNANELRMGWGDAIADYIQARIGDARERCLEIASDNE